MLIRLGKVALAAACVLMLSAASVAEPLPAFIAKARDLPANATRAQAISALGPATWAVVPMDKGEHRIQSRALYVLYWAVPGCVPVSMSFTERGTVDGLAAPHLCGAEHAPFVSLPKNYSCAKPDRARLCR